MAFDLAKVFSSFQAKKIMTPNKVVGIDYGSSSLKVVELEKREESIALTTYGELQLGPYAGEGMGASVKLPLQKKTEALVDAFRESGVTAKDGVFALPLADSFITVMSLLSTAEEDISPRVNVEARKYIPVPITDVVLEWSEVTRDTKQKGSSLTRDVLLVAIQNQSVEDNRQLLDAISMHSHPAEIELFSTMRSLFSPGDTSVALMDLGAGFTKLYIVQEGVVQKIHRVPQGGSQATKAIVAALSSGYEDAENLKRSFDAQHPQSAMLQKSVEQALERPLLEFRRVLEQYEVRVGKPIEKVILTGGVASASFVPQFVSYAVNKSATVATPFEKVSYPAFLQDTLTAIGPSFSGAVGAALRHFE